MPATEALTLSWVNCVWSFVSTTNSFLGHLHMNRAAADIPLYFMQMLLYYPHAINIFFVKLSILDNGYVFLKPVCGDFFRPVGVL